MSILSSRPFWQSTAAMVSGIIGAGILGIPYVVAQVGIIPGVLFIVGLGIISMIIHLMIAEIILRTRFRHQLVGLAQKYLGGGAKFWQAIAMLIGGYGAMLVYLIGEGQVLHSLLPDLPFNDFTWSLLFFVIAGLMVAMGLKLVKRIELFLVCFALLVVAVLTWAGWSHVNVQHYLATDWSHWYLPYGVILFAFGGTSAVMSVREILRGEEKLLKKAVITGTLIPMLVYIVFALVVVGVTGAQTSPIALTGFGQAIGPVAIVIGNVFSLISMGMGFLMLGTGVRQMFKFDFSMSRLWADVATLVVPLLLFLTVKRDFIAVMDVVGSLTFGLSGMLIILTYWKAKRFGDQKPAFSLPRWKWFGYIMMLVLLLGMFVTLWPR